MDEKVATALKRYPRLLCQDAEMNLAPNLRLLREIGVPQPSHLLVKQIEREKIDSHSQWITVTLSHALFIYYLKREQRDNKITNLSNCPHYQGCTCA
jgi:hypothetical protein